MLNRCQGQTLKGEKCRNRIRYGQYCFRHQPDRDNTDDWSESEDYDDDIDDIKEECIICCQDKHMIILSCQHKLCLDCLIKLRQPLCPFCQKDISDEIPDEHKNNQDTTTVLLSDLVTLYGGYQIINILLYSPENNEHIHFSSMNNVNNPIL